MSRVNRLVAPLSLLLKKEIISMLFLGFSAGIPILLIFSSLSLWLGEAGVEKSTVTYFSWAALAYSFKFLWAPLVDQLPIPYLTARLGRRRAWLLFSQALVIGAILWMASIDPSQSEWHLNLMALAVVMLGFSSATQDTVIDAYRIEVVKIELQSLMASAYIAGYRIGMITAGAGALILAEVLGTSKQDYQYEAWQWTYMAMALVMLVGVTTSLLIKEPQSNKGFVREYSNRQYIRFLMLFVISALVLVFSYRATPSIAQALKVLLTDILFNKVLASSLVEMLRLLFSLLLVALSIKLISISPLYERPLVEKAFIRPVTDFFERYGIKSAVLILVFVGFYRISDIVLGVISYVFYQDMGFSKIEIAAASKTFGLVMTIIGGFLGGILAATYGVMRILWLGAILVIVTNLLFVLLAQAGHDILLLYLVISADNLSGGLASTAFIAYLASLTNISFTAVQYAIFSSLMTLIPKSIGGYSGSMVTNMGYENFFFMASALGLPVLVILYWIQQIAPPKETG